MNPTAGLSRGTKIFHQICCLLLWIYILYKVIMQFSENKDTSEVSFQKFTADNDKEDGYPTFTVCIRGVNGGTFSPLIESDLYQELNNHPTCNKSGVDHPKCETSLFQKMLAGKEDILQSVTTKDFDELTVSALPIMERWRLLDDNGDWQHYNSKKMYLSYQDAFRTCFTKEYEPGTGRNLTHDMYSIEADQINLPLEIYVHQVGGLIAVMGKKYVFQITKTEIDEMYENFNSTSQNHSSSKGITTFYDFHVRKIEMLRKRVNAKKACNDSITNNDQMYKEALIKEVGCIPSYWKRFFVDGKLENLSACSNKDQYEQLANMLPTMSENSNLRTGVKLYDPPCNEMKVCTVLYKRNERHEHNKLWLGFYYDADEYLEVVNIKTYTTYDLWSQIGGVVGIFLGVSILQLPELVVRGYEPIKRMYRPEFDDVKKLITHENGGKNKVNTFHGNNKPTIQSWEVY